MFVNKINGFQNLGFKGYQHEKNSVGETVMRFNYPFDYENETCTLYFYRLRPDKNYNYKMDSEPIYSVVLKKGGVDVNLQTETNLDKNEPFAYKYIRKDKNTGAVISEGADTGVKIKVQDGNCHFRVVADKKRIPSDIEGKDYDILLNEFSEPISDYNYTFVSRKGTTPIVQGAGYLAVPDALMPGAKYRGFEEKNTGEIYIDEAYQKKMEGVVKNFSNQYGGNIAGLEYMIPQLKNDGYKIIFTTPIANGDDVSAHSYWNKNNMQIATKMGNTENLSSFFRNLYKNGMAYVYDGTFTSEGLEGIHFKYALRWANRGSQFADWFRFDDLKNTNIGLGVLPENRENLRHRVINPRFKYKRQADGTYKPERNLNYDSNKETIFQIYDASQASEHQISDLDGIIRQYENIITDGRELDINTHDDTIISYAFQIDPKEYENRVDVINDLIKGGKKIELNSSDGTVLVSHFTNFRLTDKPGMSLQTWDANSDMAKMRYNVSGYDEKKLQAITNPDLRDYARKHMEQAANEVQDLTLQVAKYWTQKQKNIVILYNAQTLGKNITTESVNKLIKEGSLPKEAALSQEVIENIKNGYYLLEPKGVLDKDSVTVKSLMSLPLDSLEFGDLVQGVLSTSYFSNRATTKETLGMSRFELLKEGNPHLAEPYEKIYNKVNDFYIKELKQFANDIINEVDKVSETPLIDKDSYTEYGEYVMELVGQDIAKYAFLKALSGNNFKSKVLENGDLTYDYENIRKTTLKSLGINANNPQEEAELLEEKISKGLKNLNTEDVKLVASSIAQRIKGTDVISFRVGEALFDRTGLGLNWRLDALKDIADMDAVRNRENSFDDALDVNIIFWGKFVEEVKKINRNSIFEAEITDIPELMRDTYGLDSVPYDGKTNIPTAKYNGENDALTKFFIETGITSEAAYSYMFTSLLMMLAPNFENGTEISKYHDDVKHRIDLLIQTRSSDYMKNFYTFLGNHDKPRVIHALAIDLKLFHSPVLVDYPDGVADFDKSHNQRQDIIRAISGTAKDSEIPIELRLNVDNNDYFKTVSSRAAAQSKLLINSIDDAKLDKNTAMMLKQAIGDITNGNYLADKESKKITRINIKELSSLEDAFGEVINLAGSHGLHMSDSAKRNLIKDVVNQVNSMDITDYLVRGDFNWDVPNKAVGDKNRNDLIDFVGKNPDYEKYNIYTVKLAQLLKNAYLKSGKNTEAKNALLNGLKDFVNKYDNNTVNSKTDAVKEFESTVEAQRKNGYGVRSIRKAIEMVVRQAEFKQGSEISNKEDIIEKIYQAATEPAVTKAAIGTELLKALIGINTTFYGDERGQTGLEDKAKNISQQNRLVLPEYKNTEYGKKIHKVMTDPVKDRINPDLAPLNNGDTYIMDVVINGQTRDEICKRIQSINTIIREQKPSETDKAKLLSERHELTRNLAKFAYLRQSADGNMVISLCDTGWVNNESRHDYFKENNINSEKDRKEFFEKNSVESINEKNPYVPIMPQTELDYILLGSGIALPVGTVFLNSNANDKARYIVKKVGKGLGIAKEDGGKIVINSKTFRNGVMNLFHKIGFKGRSHQPVYNKKFNIVSNPYKKADINEEGLKLSIVSKGW